MADHRINPSYKVVIIGSGCFGISTALHLLARGYKDVTVLDRAPVVPAADAASTDLNKIVRSSYHDPFYTQLCREAISRWKDRSEWGDLYHESGVLVFGAGEAVFSGNALANDVAHGARVKKVLGASASPKELAKTNKNELISLHELFPGEIPLGRRMSSACGFLNFDGGWAFAEGGVARAIELVRTRGGKVLARKEVIQLLKSDNGKRTRGVRCKDGSEFEADIVVIATGSWTASAFPELRLGDKCLATGQSIATIQLTPRETELYRRTPVVLDFGPSGFYIFPPNEHGVVKFAKHAVGYTNFLPAQNSPDGPKISTPRTILSHGTDGLKIPKGEAKFLRDCLKEVYPGLAKKPFASTRLCWYTDSPDSDWIIDIHPTDTGLALATAGSGHGFKFLPVIGRVIADRLEGKLAPDVQRKFALDRPMSGYDPTRDGRPVGALNVDELCGPGDV